jgi:hypothetical protein
MNVPVVPFPARRVNQALGHDRITFQGFWRRKRLQMRFALLADRPRAAYSEVPKRDPMKVKRNIPQG